MDMDLSHVPGPSKTDPSRTPFILPLPHCLRLASPLSRPQLLPETEKASSSEGSESEAPIFMILADSDARRWCASIHMVTCSLAWAPPCLVDAVLRAP